MNKAAAPSVISIMRALLVCLLLSACFGHSIQRIDSANVFENLGQNRYRYYLTRSVQSPPQKDATMAPVAPQNAEGIGLIEVSVEYSGLGPGGLRSYESEFQPMLSKLAGEMGGSHVVVLRSTKKDTVSGSWINSLTAAVLLAR